MRARLILHWVLQESKAGKADPGEGRVIGAAGLDGTAGGGAHDGGGAEIVERDQPGFEYWLNHVVAADVDPAELASAGVIVVVGGELVEFRAELHAVAAGEAFLHICL